MTTETVNPFDFPSIFVVDQAAHNSGNTRGLWVDATQDANLINSDITIFMNDSPMPESGAYFVQNHHGFEGCEIGQNDSIESIHLKAKIIDEHGKLGALILANHHGDEQEALNILNNKNRGQFNSLEDFARKHIKELNLQLPEYVLTSIDYDLAVTKILTEFCLFKVEVGPNEIHIFENY